MSRRNKLQKFAEVAEFQNVFENFGLQNAALSWCGRPVMMHGQWAPAHFHNQHPITLELACGKGEYSVGLAQLFPQRNFIGVDVKGARIWKGARHAIAAGITNAAFLRTRIEQLASFFAPGEVSEIWIVFPDPFPRDSKSNRRLTAPHFLDIYRKVMAPDGIVNLKTDDEHLYDYTLSVIRDDPQCTLLYESNDIYTHKLFTPELEIKTFYEMQHLAAGKKIKYIRLSINKNRD